MYRADTSSYILDCTPQSRRLVSVSSNEKHTGTDRTRPASHTRRAGLRLVPNDDRSSGQVIGSQQTPADVTTKATFRSEPLIDYRLQRRAVLRDLRCGAISLHEVCDASPYLLRAAGFFGEQTQTACPACRKGPLWQVCFVYGDAVGPSAGQACNVAALAALARRVGECEIYRVEVCQGCTWNHLLEKFLLMPVADLALQPNTVEASAHCG